MTKGRVTFSVSLLLLAALLQAPATLSHAQSEKKNDEERTPTVRRDSEANADKQDILLVAGIQTVLDLTFKPCEPVAECVKVINPSLVTVQYAAEKKQLIFTPVKNGETTISVRDEAGDMRLILKTVVSNSNLARAAREIKDLLKDIEGIEIRILGNKIIADGEVIVPGDLNRVMAVLGDAAYKELVLNLVTVSPIGQKILAKRIQDEINNPKISCRVMNGTFILEGTVESANEAKRAEQILLNLMPEKAEFAVNSESVILKRPKKPPYINLIVVSSKKETPQPKMVRLTVDFVELAKNYARNFGFSWQPSLDNGGTFQFGPSTTGGITSTSSGALSGTIANLFPKLASAQSAGYARVLQEAIIITQSGVEGNLTRKTKIPVLVLDKNGNQTYEGVGVGLQVKLRPSVSQDNVSLVVSFSFSQISGRAGSGQSAPIVATSDYQGTVVVRNNESAALANLITNDVLTDYNKDAPGSSTPTNPLFSLLRSKAFAKSKSQFVVFITPQVLDSASSGTEDIKKKYGIKKR